MINRFEAKLAAAGTLVVKCFLHISARSSASALLARLDDPTKHWKYNPGDLESRARWDDYMAAYEDALERCGRGGALARRPGRSQVVPQLGDHASCCSRS